MLVIWKERASPLRERRGAARAVMSSPPKRTCPASGGSSPESCLMKVVLPAPFGPITACVSPARTSKSTWSVATSAPNALLSLRTSSRASVIFSGQQPRKPALGEQHHEHEDHAQVEPQVVVHPSRQHAPALKHVFQQQPDRRAEQRAG